MFVWWAVFFFAGAFFPAASSVAGAALGTASTLFFIHRSSSPELRTRFILTCASCILILTAASLAPVKPIGSSKRRAVLSESFPPPVRAVRNKLLELTDEKRLTDKTRSLLRALLIADRKTLSPEIRSDFRRTGTAHYLALSGLHLGLIALPLFGVLTLAGARGIVRDFLALFVLAFYAAAAGRPGSLLRALSMMVVLRSSRLAGIRTGPGRCVLSGAFLVCILDPASLNDTGFLLSFNAAAGVAILGIPACGLIQRRLTLPRVLLVPLQSLLMSLCVQLSMLPFLLKAFGFAPLIGPIMSVILALPITFLLYGGFIYVIAGHLSASVATVPLNTLSALVCGIVSRGAEVSGSGLITGDLDVRMYVPGLVVTACSFRAGKYRTYLLAFGLLLSALSFHPFPAGRGYSGNNTIRLKNGGAFLTGGKSWILVIDRTPSEWAAPFLSREIHSSGVRKVETLVVLDAGEFEPEGLAALAEELGIERVLLSPWIEVACAGIPAYIFVRADTVLEAGGKRIAVRAPLVLPGRGASAGGTEASLTISPLD